MSYVQGLSGLNAASSQLGAIGNNVANANTVGFKGSQAQFGDVFAAALNGGSSATQVGIGVKLQTIAQQFAQGNITATNSSLDMAVNGGGFFMLNNAQGTTYSRNGQFQLDKNGFIVNSTGDKLQGYQIVNGKPSGSPTALTVPTAVASAAATGSITGTIKPGIVVGANLNSTLLPPPPASSTFNPADPNTYNNSTSTTTYDSKGVAQTTTMYFVKQSALDTAVPPALPSIPPTTGIVTAAGVTTVTPTTPLNNLTVGAVVQGANFPAGTTITSTTPAGAVGPYTSFTTSAPPSTVPTTASILTIDVPNNWNVYTTVTDPATGATLFPTSTTGAVTHVPNGILTFNPSGSFNAFAPNTTATAPVAPATGADPTTTSITLYPTGASTETIPFDFTASTQFGTAFGVNTITQNGYTAGQLNGFSVGTDGTIQGKYSNGQTKPLGQVALATFPDNQGLQPMGSNAWSQTAASGSPVVNAPGTGNNGVLQTSSTESSSVDLTSELVNMMTAQRYYQANAQTIKTQDSVMSTLLNMR